MLDGAGQADGALARAAGEEEDRVGQLLARQRGDHDHVQVDLRALRLRGIEGPLEHAALRVVLQADQAASAQGQRRGCRRGGIGRTEGQAACAGQRESEGARQPRRAPAHARTGQAAALCLSVVWFMRIRSVAPPMNSPLTKIMGNVVQPVHSFSGRRLRHSLA